MSDRKARKNKGAQPSVLENPAFNAEPQGAAEFHVPETFVAPCAIDTTPVESFEIVAAEPFAIEPTETITAEAAPAEATSSIEPKGPEIMTDQINETIENTTQAGRVAADRIQSAFGDVNARAKTGMEKSAKVMEEMTELTRGNVEALVASGKIAARGVETLTQEAADFGRRSFEEASATLKSFTEVKSATDFFRLQSDFARAQFDAMVSESSKLSETVLKLAGDVAQPLTNRYTVAAERVKTLAN